MAERGFGGDEGSDKGLLPPGESFQLLEILWMYSEGMELVLGAWFF